MPRSNWVEIPTPGAARALLNLNQVVRVTPAKDGTALFLLADGNTQESSLSYEASRALVIREAPLEASWTR